MSDNWNDILYNYFHLYNNPLDNRTSRYFPKFFTWYLYILHIMKLYIFYNLEISYCMLNINLFCLYGKLPYDLHKIYNLLMNIHRNQELIHYKIHKISFCLFQRRLSLMYIKYTFQNHILNILRIFLYNPYIFFIKILRITLMGKHLYII